MASGGLLVRNAYVKRAENKDARIRKEREARKLMKQRTKGKSNSVAKLSIGVIILCVTLIFVFCTNMFLTLSGNNKTH